MTTLSERLAAAFTLLEEAAANVGDADSLATLRAAARTYSRVADEVDGDDEPGLLRTSLATAERERDEARSLAADQDTAWRVHERARDEAEAKLRMVERERDDLRALTASRDVARRDRDEWKARAEQAEAKVAAMGAQGPATERPACWAVVDGDAFKSVWTDESIARTMGEAVPLYRAHRDAAWQAATGAATPAGVRRLTEGMMADAYCNKVDWIAVECGRKIETRKAAASMFAALTAASPVVLPVAAQAAPVASDEEIARDLYAATAVPGAYDDLPWESAHSARKAWTAAVAKVRAKLVTGAAGDRPASPDPERADDIEQAAFLRGRAAGIEYAAGFTPPEQRERARLRDAVVEAAQASCEGDESPARRWVPRLQGAVRALNDYLAAPPVTTPTPERFVVVPAGEVGGRPARYWTTREKTDACAARCNAGDEFYHINTGGPHPSGPWAVVDTAPAPVAPERFVVVPSIDAALDAFGAAAVEEHRTRISRSSSIGDRRAAVVAYDDARDRLRALLRAAAPAPLAPLTLDRLADAMVACDLAGDVPALLAAIGAVGVAPDMAEALFMALWREVGSAITAPRAPWIAAMRRALASLPQRTVSVEQAINAASVDYENSRDESYEDSMRTILTAHLGATITGGAS